MNDEDWKEMNLRVVSAIRLNLGKNVLANVHGISTTKKSTWEKLEVMY